jgi:hypothetical protein
MHLCIYQGVIRSAAARWEFLGADQPFFRGNTKTPILYLYINNLIKISITPQPLCLKTLCLIPPTKEPSGLMQNQYQSKGTCLSLCNCLIGAGRSPY